MSTENYYKAKELERDIYNISWTIGKIVRNVQKITRDYDKGVNPKISSSDCPEINDRYPGINGNTQGDKKLTNPAPKAINNSNIYPVFFIAADIPAIDVNRASFKNLLSKVFFFVFIFFITIG